MARPLVSALIAAGLAGCQFGATRTVTVREPIRVEVPVAVKREPPAELVAPYKPDAVPLFVAPSHPEATSALTPEGERALRILINDLMARDEAWRAWGAAP